MLDSQVEDEASDPVISIGILAERVGLSVSTIRKYEQDGLLIAHRGPSGHRLFSHEDISRVRYIHHLFQDLGMNADAIHWIQSLLPCWTLIGCSLEERGRCAAYGAHTKPCWMIRGKRCVPQENDCRRCEVYRFGSLCTEDIGFLLHRPADRRQVVLRKLLLRRRHSQEEEL